MKDASYKVSSAGIVVSLIVHALLLYLILFYYWYHRKQLPAHTYEVAFIDDLPPEKLTSWAATQARKSNFAMQGQDPADEIAQQFHQQQEESIAVQEKQKQIVEKIKDIIAEREYMATVVDEGRAVAAKDTEQKAEEKKEDHKEAVNQEKKSVISADAPARTVTHKVQPTFAQLAQGFLTYARTEGNNAVTMEGGAGELSAEQLKHERYLEKLNWCLQYAFRTNQDKFPYRYMEALRLKIYMALDKNAVITELRIVTSSGIPSLDRFTIDLFNQASSSFPPVPQYLPHDPYGVVYTIEFNGDDNVPFCVSRS